MVGEVMFYGQGAGKHATASAVVADMMDAIAHREKRRPVEWGDGSRKLLLPIDQLRAHGTCAAKYRQTSSQDSCRCGADRAHDRSRAA